jgi:hypothetical protein
MIQSFSPLLIRGTSHESITIGYEAWRPFARNVRVPSSLSFW